MKKIFTIIREVYSLPLSILKKIIDIGSVKDMIKGLKKTNPIIKKSLESIKEKTKPTIDKSLKSLEGMKETYQKNQEEKRKQKEQQEIKRKEEEEKRKQEEEKQLIINQEKTGFKLSKTRLTEDKFDGTVTISTTRYGRFESNHFNQVGVDQSINLFVSEFSMLSANIESYKGLWCSVLMIQKKSLREFFIEFHFRKEELTTSVTWDTQPNCENSSLEILYDSEKFTQKNIEILENQKNEYRRDIRYFNLKLIQTFRFKVDEPTLKKMSQTKCEFRLSNFPNVGDTNHWEFNGVMNNKVTNLIQEFLSDMN